MWDEGLKHHRIETFIKLMKELVYPIKANAGVVSRGWRNLDVKWNGPIFTVLLYGGPGGVQWHQLI